MEQLWDMLQLVIRAKLGRGERSKPLISESHRDRQAGRSLIFHRRAPFDRDDAVIYQHSIASTEMSVASPVDSDFFGADPPHPDKAYSGNPRSASAPDRVRWSSRLRPQRGRPR